MYLNKFSVRIIGGREDHSGYVRMRQGKTYKIALRNDYGVRAEARVEVDGKDCGTFILRPNRTTLIERPVNSRGCFTFTKLGTKLSRAGELQKVRKADRGHIKVTLTPELPPEMTWTSVWTCCEECSCTPCNCGYYGSTIKTIKINDQSIGCSTTLSTTSGTAALDNVTFASTASSFSPDYKEGGTVLTGKSSQNFVKVSGLDLDESKTTVINLRLVAKGKKTFAEPLVCCSNPVPPAV